jgi:hypothetical protein
MLLWALFLSVSVHAQSKKYGAWYFQEGCSKTTVNGLGLAIISGGYCEQDSRQVTNGIQFDILGRGIIPPIIYTTLEEMEVYQDRLRVMQKVNGLAVSPGGLAFMGTLVNGVNLFGISTMCGKVNGISAGGLLSYNLWTNGISISLINGVHNKMNGLQIGGTSTAGDINGVQIAGVSSAERMHGLQIGAVNITEKHRGVQIGLFNKAKDLKGVQIGLWNKCGKRSLPFLNFQF